MESLININENNDHEELIEVGILQRKLFLNIEPIPFSIPCLNILLFGEYGVGKSTFVNGVFTALSDRVKNIAVTAPVEGEHVTLEYIPYNLIDYGINVPVCLYDTWGWDIDNYKQNEFSHMLEGNLRHLTRSTETIKPLNREEGIKSIVDLKNKIHCICFFISTRSLDNTEYKKKLNEFQVIANQKGVPYIVIVTMPDEEDPQIIDFPEKLTTSIKVKAVIKKQSKMLGVNKRDIFPVLHNFLYDKNPYIDQYVLRAFSLCIDKAKDYLVYMYNRILIKMKSEEVDNKIKKRKLKIEKFNY